MDGWSAGSAAQRSAAQRSAAQRSAAQRSADVMMPFYAYVARVSISGDDTDTDAAPRAREVVAMARALSRIKFK